MASFPKRSVVLVALLLGAAPAMAELLGAQEVLRRLDRAAASANEMARSGPAELLADIQRFRRNHHEMDPKHAAAAWLGLYERAAGMGRLEWQGDPRQLDVETSQPVGLASVLAALPSPEAWPALRQAAAARAAATPQDRGMLSVRLLAEVLSGDRAAAATTLAELDALIAKLPRSEAPPARAHLARLRAELARLYGTPDEIAAAFLAALEANADRRHLEVQVPDLVGLVGEARAAAMLREAVLKEVPLHVPEGDATRRLAREAARDQAALLRVPQWGLVDGIAGAPLYEALERRFQNSGSEPELRRQEAQTYYFLHLVVSARHADAEKALRTLAGTNALVVPKKAIEALQRAGYDEALYGFLHGLLRRHPELHAWDVYLRQAALTGNSAAALALVETLLKRSDLPAPMLTELRFHRANALLAADRIEPALRSLRELLAPRPQRAEHALKARTDAAMRLTGLGRVLDRPEHAHAGLAFAEAVLVLEDDDRERSWERETLLRQVFAEQRKLGLAERAQMLALNEILSSSTSRAALVELAGLYSAAGRHHDVVRLLDESRHWGARDLRELLAEKDSLGVPLGLIAARALAGTGERPAALELARAVLEKMPAYDPAYELLVEIDSNAGAFFDRLYARDRFEERPLIWKAVALLRLGRTVEAESLVRNAIAIDPSDGDEGPSDRMRAYAVLAEVLEARGEKQAAARFRSAVGAIRLSERSDELHRLGLHERAFAGYRQALELFADAYCIQSRLAVRLHEQGRRREALEHYRRAYELMPASFGRVESHCFGCESVFQGPAAQGMAEKVFNDLLLKEPKRPQIHYLLGILQREQGRAAEALARFGEAVRLDPEYLNAWKQVHELARHVYVDARERDAARLKLIELDPAQRHARYDTDSIGDLAALWRALHAAAATQEALDAGKPLYPLRRSAATLDEEQARLPEPMQRQLQQMQELMKAAEPGHRIPTPQQALGRHRLVRAIFD